MRMLDKDLLNPVLTDGSWAAEYYSHLWSRTLPPDENVKIKKTGFTKGNWAAGYYSHLWSRMLAEGLIFLPDENLK